MVPPRVASSDRDAVVDRDHDDVRAKGGAHSALFVRDERGVRGLAQDGGVAEVGGGDTLQVAVTSSSDIFAAVLSVDGAGARSTFVATADDGLVQVSPGRNVPLPQATVLDDTAGLETVAVFLCRHAGARVSALWPSALQGAPPPGCVVERYRLHKKARR